ncbi:hypothetical protein C5167_016385 [Papaver somniferum]|nr:hypothetical protein C5167_016385 [Papaver somniferum]
MEGTTSGSVGYHVVGGGDLNYLAEFGGNFSFLEVHRSDGDVVAGRDWLQVLAVSGCLMVKLVVLQLFMLLVVASVMVDGPDLSGAAIATLIINL